MKGIVTAYTFAALLAQAASQACTSAFCQNGGVCLIVYGSPACACVAGYLGKNCEIDENNPDPTAIANACVNQPCLNGGLCTPAGDLFTCACPTGFFGTVCQSKVILTTARPSALPNIPSSCAQGSNKTTLGCGMQEIVFMIEYSRGDSYFDVDHEGDFIKRLIGQWRVDSSHIRIGLVTYHDAVAEAIHLDDYENDSRGLTSRITRLVRGLYPKGTNDLSKALDYVKTTAFAGARPGAEKIVIPLVHMMPNETRSGIVESANRLKSDCVTIIGMAIKGSRAQFIPGYPVTDPEDLVDQSIMSQLVTAPSSAHYVEFDDFSDLEDSYRDFDDTRCP